jgi:hypothetical protein
MKDFARPTEAWTKQLARSVIRVIRNRTRQPVISWQALRIERHSSDSLKVPLGSFLSHPGVTVAIWAEVSDPGGFVASREFVSRRLSFEIGVWIDGPESQIRTVAKRASKFYPTEEDDAINASSRPILFSNTELVAFGFQPGLSVPSSGRPANPLFVTDTALFVYQLARLSAGKAATRPRVSGYCAASPGVLKSVPGNSGILSLFHCPVCRTILYSTMNSCDHCEWEYHDG